jgi:hypothetical protein
MIYAILKKPTEKLTEDYMFPNKCSKAPTAPDTFSIVNCELVEIPDWFKNLYFITIL